MKWTNKKPTKEGFYLYVDQLNTDGKPIILEAIDITDAGCQPDAPADMKMRKGLLRKYGRDFQAEYQNENEGIKILFQWSTGAVNLDKNAFWSAEPIALPMKNPRRAKKENHIEKGSVVTYKGYLYVVSSCNKTTANLANFIGVKLAFKKVPLEKLTPRQPVL